MEAFDYLKPETVAECIALLTQYKGKARVIAGGQSLIPMLRSNLVTPAYLIGLEAISELRNIQPLDGGLRIGAMSSHLEVATSELVKERAPILSEAESILGSPAVRNLGTIGGNLCHNETGADPPPTLVALGATAVMSGPAGERRLPIENFFKGFLETVLEEDELLTYIDVPASFPGMASAYIKYSLRAVDRATVGVAVVLSMDGKKCKDARLALGGVAPVPFRSKEAEAVLKGNILTESIFERAARIAMAEARPISDAHASADYRRQMTAVFVRRALKKALGMNS